jgi:hypothetical protein
MAGHCYHVKYKCFMPAAGVDSSLQFSISVKTMHTASYSIIVQNMNPRTSPSPKPGRMSTRVAALAFDLFVLYFRPSHGPLSSLSSENTGKQGACKFNRILVSMVVRLTCINTLLVLLTILHKCKGAEKHKKNQRNLKNYAEC